ncbi:MAG: hypothetical protein WBA46_18815, partial [Thermomicrobiales bacterium]
LALVAIGQRNDQDRWQRLTHDKQQEHLARAHRHNELMQERSLPNATSRFRRWQPWEDAVLLADDAPPDHVLAEDLNRTLHGVRQRLHTLRKRQKPS